MANTDYLETSAMGLVKSLIRNAQTEDETEFAYSVHDLVLKAMTRLNDCHRRIEALEKQAKEDRADIKHTQQKLAEVRIEVARKLDMRVAIVALAGIITALIVAFITAIVVQ